MTGGESDDLTDAARAQSPGGPTVLRIVLGSQLRRMREACGVSAEEAGRKIRASQSKISRMELGRLGFKERDVADLLALYGQVDENRREALLALARQANVPGWWHQYGDILPNWFEVYIGLEEAASLIRAYDVQFIPGLLQTEDYAMACVSLWHSNASNEELNRRTNLRMHRQRLLTRDNAPELQFLIDEAALRRPLGGPETIRSQLQRLVEVSALPNVTLQVIPFEANRQAAAGCAFSILEFSQHGMTNLVYLEQVTSALYLEKRADIEEYLRIMDKMSDAALDPTATIQALHAIIADLDSQRSSRLS